MLILGTTTDKIQVILSNVVTTNQLDCIATYKDITTSAYSGSAPILVTTNNTTAVDLVGAPASNTQRIVDFISIYNNDTANATVTVRINRNGSIGILFRCTLTTSESLVYSEGAGWNIHSNNGLPKQFLSYDTSLNSSLTPSDASVTPAKMSGAQSGSAPAYACRAWANFNGTGTVAIRASGNVSSITDNGVGLWTINFTIPMQDANYSAIVQYDHQSSSNRGIGLTSTYSASSFQVSSEDKSGTFGGSRADSSTISVAVFR